MNAKVTFAHKGEKGKGRKDTTPSGVGEEIFASCVTFRSMRHREPVQQLTGDKAEGKKGKGNPDGGYGDTSQNCHW